MDEPPRTSASAWQRFLDQKTAPQRLLIALAGIVAALVTIGGGVYAASKLFDGAADRESTQPMLAGRSIEQGTAVADAFVRRLLQAADGRLKLDHLIVAPARDVPFEHGDIRLHYNCRGKPVGTDNCNLVRLQVPNDSPPQIVDKTTAYFTGTYAIRVVSRGATYGTDFDVAFDDLAQ